VKPETGEYGFVQNLHVRELDQGTYPMVPNPYTLLPNLLGDSQHYTVLDLKDTSETFPQFLKKF
jgi:hypothetical protein